MKSLYWILLLMFFCGPMLLFAQQKSLSVTISADEVKGLINKNIYGLTLEHIYHSCNGGLWGEMVWNRSFEEALTADGWFVSNGELCSPVSRQGKVSQMIIGDGAWRNYELSLRFWVEKETGEIQIGFLHTNGASAGPREMREGYSLILGGNNNNLIELQLRENDKTSGKIQSKTLQTVPGKIRIGQWNLLRIKCTGRQIQTWVNDSSVVNYKSTSGPIAGWINLGVNDNFVKFRDIKVMSSNGYTLFEGIPAPTRHWQVVGNGQISLDTASLLNGIYSLRLRNKKDSAFIYQRNISVLRPDYFSGSFWAFGDAPKGVIIQITDNNRVIAETRTSPLSNKWKEYSFSFKLLNIDFKNASLKIGVIGAASFNIDQVSLMPGSALETGGYRVDLFQAVSGLRPAMIRWPGTSFAEDFFWKNSIGAQRTRIGKTGWDEQDPLAFGLDEFIEFCKKNKSEPVITINLKDQNPDRLDDALDLVQYCNGESLTTWGKVRSNLGHTKPYQVKYWELGNAGWQLPPDKYAETAALFAQAIKKADSSAQIIVCGSAGLGREGIGMEWNKKILETCSSFANYIGIHHYESSKNVKEGPDNFERFIAELNQSIRQSSNPNLKIFISEWNAQSTDWRTGLYCASMLNVFERNDVAAAFPSLLLRHTSAPAWDNAFINFDNNTWYAAPNYLVTRLWRSNFGGKRILVTSDSSELSISASANAKGEKIFVKVVNPGSEARTVKLKLVSAQKLEKADLKIIAPGAINARNSFSNPNRVDVSEAKIEYADSAFHFVMPPISAGIVILQK
jgi:alpha-N-arabinofuranosidase